MPLCSSRTCSSSQLVTPSQGLPKGLLCLVIDLTDARGDRAGTRTNHASLLEGRQIFPCDGPIPILVELTECITELVLGDLPILVRVEPVEQGACQSRFRPLVETGELI